MVPIETPSTMLRMSTEFTRYPTINVSGNLQSPHTLRSSGSSVENLNRMVKAKCVYVFCLISLIGVTIFSIPYIMNLTIPTIPKIEVPLINIPKVPSIPSIPSIPQIPSIPPISSIPNELDPIISL